MSVLALSVLTVSVLALSVLTVSVQTVSVLSLSVPQIRLACAWLGHVLWPAHNTAGRVGAGERQTPVSKPFCGPDLAIEC